MNTEKLTLEQKKAIEAQEKLSKFIDSLPIIPSIKNPRVRNGSMLIALGYPKGNIHPRKSYEISPEQLSREKHHANLEILAIRNGGLTDKLLKDYKKAALDDYNASINSPKTSNYGTAVKR